MNATREAAFDKIASRYDEVWSDTPVGKTQRSAVWRRIDPLFRKHDFVLDLGCGTGVDAMHLQSRGVSVYGIDSSSRMIEIATRRGIEAHCWPIERLQHFELRLDGAISNFGALNCLASLSTIAGPLGRMVRSGGHVALCVLSPVCLWETAFYLSQGRLRKAFRRLHGPTTSSMGVKVFYHSGAAIKSAFRKEFRLVGFYGVGVSTPPSYITSFADSAIERLSALDRHLDHKPIFRSLADHRLYIFERI